MHLVVSGHFHTLDALCPGKEPLYTLNRRPVGPIAGRFWEAKSFLHLQEIESYFHSLFTNRLRHPGFHSPNAVASFHFTSGSDDCVSKLQFHVLVSSLFALSTQCNWFKNFTKLQSVIKLSCSTSGNDCCTQWPKQVSWSQFPGKHWVSEVFKNGEV
jgi:hypothetical protein